MRRIISLLLLAVAAPALASEPDGDSPRPEREARSERPMRAMVERMQRAERSEPRVEREQVEVERPRRAERRQREVVAIEQGASSVAEEPRSSPVSVERGERIGGELRERGWRERRVERRRSSELPQSAPSPVMGEALANPRAVDSATGVQGERRMGNVLRNRIATEGWRREWRDDRRYDWRRHRDRDRSRFRLGFYYDPFGWNYRRWNLGWSIPSRFYSSRYWINDPFHYRLPPAYGPYRWVRYWDDALLVDLRTGRVVDVIHNFFW
jgi:Ni/Co efflux regulator RcnB